MVAVVVWAAMGTLRRHELADLLDHLSDVAPPLLGVPDESDPDELLGSHQYPEEEDSQLHSTPRRSERLRARAKCYPGLETSPKGQSDGQLVFWDVFPVMHAGVNSGKTRRASVIRLAKYVFVTAFGVFLRTATRPEVIAEPLVFHSLYIDPEVQILFAHEIRLRRGAKESTVEFTMHPLWHCNTQVDAPKRIHVPNKFVTEKILPALARLARTRFDKTRPVAEPAPTTATQSRPGEAEMGPRCTTAAAAGDRQRRLGLHGVALFAARSLFRSLDETLFAKLMPVDAYERASPFLQDFQKLHKWNLFDATPFVLVQTPNYGKSLWSERPCPVEKLRPTALAVVRCVRQLADADLAHNDVRLPNLVKCSDGGVKLIDFDRCTRLARPLPPSCQAALCLELPGVTQCAPLALHQTTVCILLLAGTRLFPRPRDAYLFTEKYFRRHPPHPAIADIVHALVPPGYEMLARPWKSCGPQPSWLLEKLPESL
ncbi:hypothetical protein PAPYR_8742 [Paratrimastix pyriformis]|uniref:Protein kinase domain-containing protein n=1 Tax=Paratrimastix pyriformis TaxID=342808 RepID=A0ABQ8UFM9_9EUKA|nr:hypothetical protein PAPYR_8742 [Paratrimastix pyriformis]